MPNVKLNVGYCNRVHCYGKKEAGTGKHLKVLIQYKQIQK